MPSSRRIPTTRSCRQPEERLAAQESLADRLWVKTPEKATLTFNSMVTNELQDLADTNFKFYKRVTDDESFVRHFLDWLFDRLQQQAEDRRV